GLCLCGFVWVRCWLVLCVVVFVCCVLGVVGVFGWFVVGGGWGFVVFFVCCVCCCLVVLGWACWFGFVWCWFWLRCSGFWCGWVVVWVAGSDGWVWWCFFFCCLWGCWGGCFWWVCCWWVVCFVCVGWVVVWGGLFFGWWVVGGWVVGVGSTVMVRVSMLFSRVLLGVAGGVGAANKVVCVSCAGLFITCQTCSVARVCWLLAVVLVG
ncbi:hypothetical protein, partial [Neisseria sp. P0022.S002]|uniref:hypothetical protein n=1 Tax=Neisseria sp. P0022.S002 TaxID=3436827 RepID=UPI003F8219C4